MNINFSESVWNQIIIKMNLTVYDKVVNSGEN